MMRLLFFIVIFVAADGLGDYEIVPLRDYDVIHVVDNHNTCSGEEAGWWANDFLRCFTNRKHKSSPRLFNIVARLLDHSKSCIKFATLECRPNYDGFMHIMEKVIDIIKKYSFMHLERLIKAGVIAYSERDKIRDMDCIENILTANTYAICFRSVISTYEKLLGQNETFDLIFQKEVEAAILCTNAANKECSMSIKTDLNKVVRYILGVKQPEKDDFEKDPMTTEPLTLTESAKLLPGLRKIANENVDKNFQITNLPFFTRRPNFTDFPKMEKEDIENNLKTTKLFESSEFTEENNGDDQKISDTKKSSNFTESSIFIERIIITRLINPPKSDKGNILNDSKISEDTELSEITLSELSKTTDFPKPPVNVFKSTASMIQRKEAKNPQFTVSLQTLKTTEFPIFNDPQNSTGLNVSKDVVKETGKDIAIDIFEWEEDSTATTEFPKSMEALKSSTILNLRESNDNPQFTKTTEFPKLKNMNFTRFDIFISETGESMITEPLDLESKPTEFTQSSKLTDLPKLILSTKLLKSTDLLKSTASTNPIQTTNLQKSIASTKPPIPINLPKSSTMLSKPKDRPESTASTKIPKPTVPLQSTASTRRPRPILRKSTASTMPPRTPRTIHFRSRDRFNPPPPPPRPTEPPRPWYDFIVQPFVSLWRTIKSWFGW